MHDPSRDERNERTTHLALLHDVEEADDVQVALCGACAQLGGVLDFAFHGLQRHSDRAVRGDVHDLRGEGRVSRCRYAEETTTRVKRDGQARTLSATRMASALSNPSYTTAVPPRLISSPTRYRPLPTSVLGASSCRSPIFSVRSLEAERVLFRGTRRRFGATWDANAVVSALRGYDDVGDRRVLARMRRRSLAARVRRSK